MDKLMKVVTELINSVEKINNNVNGLKRRIDQIDNSVDSESKRMNTRLGAKDAGEYSKSSSSGSGSGQSIVSGNLVEVLDNKDDMKTYICGDNSWIEWTAEHGVMNHEDIYCITNVAPPSVEVIREMYVQRLADLSRSSNKMDSNGANVFTFRRSNNDTVEQVAKRDQLADDAVIPINTIDDQVYAYNNLMDQILEAEYDYKPDRFHYVRSQDSVSEKSNDQSLSPFIPLCRRHNCKCIVKTVRKNSINFGRKFWTCPAAFNCYFKWVDVADSLKHGESDGSSGSGGSGGAGGSGNSGGLGGAGSSGGSGDSSGSDGLGAGGSGGSGDNGGSSGSGGSVQYDGFKTARELLSLYRNNNNNNNAKIRPKSELKFWQTAEEIHRDGMDIRFIDEFDKNAVVKSFVKNNIPIEFRSIMKERLTNYLKDGVIVQVDKADVKFLASLSMVPRKNEPANPREILNFVELNRYIRSVACAVPNKQDLLRLVNLGNVAGSIDIKSCYTNIKLHPQAQPYCCIYWEGLHYMFTKVPFGIKCAPAACQTLTRSFCGSDLEIVYLDDYLLTGTLSDQLQKRLFEISNDLSSVGLPINFKKSILQPRSQVDFLGYTLDFNKHALYNQPQKIQTLKDWIDQFVVNKSCTVKEWSSFKGLYSFCRTLEVDEAVERFIGDKEKVARSCNSCTIVLDDLDLKIIGNIPSRCQLPFDH